VNRSVITGTIAAVVLSAGAAMAAAAPALADPPGPGTVADAGSPDAGSRGNDRTEGTRKRGQAVTRPTTAEPGAATKEPWPCPWPAVVPPAPASSGSDRGGNGVLAGLPIGATPVVPVPRIAGATEPQPAEFDISEFDIPELDIPELDIAEYGEASNAAPIAAELPTQPAADATGAGPAAVDLSPAPAPAPAQLPAPAILSPPMGSPAPPPPAAPLTRTAIAPRVVPAPPAQRQSSADPALSVRLGYPDELRSADITKLALMALPGLAAIAGMTALGGVIGYRQARAGYVLQTAGAGRFLQ
jgi:hypothetical protein